MAPFLLKYRLKISMRQPPISIVAREISCIACNEEQLNLAFLGGLYFVREYF